MKKPDRLELPEAGEALFSFDETGAILGCSTPTLRRMIAAGTIDAIRIGNQVRFRASELRRFVAAAPPAEARFRARGAGGAPHQAAA